MRLLLCAENAVAGIAQTGHDVAVLVQVIVQRTGIDVHIRVQLLDVFDALREIQETATARMEQMMAELLKANPAPDKKLNQMAWVQHMNMLKAQAEEVILTELINS